MVPPCFISPTPTLQTSFTGLRLSSTSSRAAPPQTACTTRAELQLIPGVPPGEDVRDNAPMRAYVPRPIETYENRGFATVLPKTWEGVTETIGVSDVSLTEKDIEKARIIQVSAESTGAFLDYGQMVKDDRAKELADLKARNEMPTTGRATCGEEEGKTYVSNYRTVLVEGVKAVEYWGKPNGPVPKLFGGPSA